MKSGALADSVLVGREMELEELNSLLNEMLEGKGKIVLISGEAGSGKTRLARDFLKTAKKLGVGVMAGWCLSDAQAPYFPFVEAFHSYFLASEEEDPSTPQTPGFLPGVPAMTQMVGGERGVATWLTGPTPAEKQGKLEAVSPQVWKDQVYAGVAGTLYTISAGSPVILFLEDIQWADSASLALLHYVARAIDNKERILVLATYRSEELTADSEGHPHPLSETLRLMKREDLFTEINLPSLSPADVAEIAKNMIGGNLQEQLAGQLAAESRGNPLFVVESLRMFNERRSLVQEDDGWRLAIYEFGIPSKIKDIILRRLAVLKYTQRRVLDAASVIGEKFDAQLLSTVLGIDYLEVLETLNAISHSTSLIGVEGNCYKFDHARSRETLYDELSAPLKKGYHQRVAERLESAGEGGRLPYSELAYHYAQAGNLEKTEKFSLSAGKDALERFSNTEAIKHFSYLLQTVGEKQEKAEMRCTALEGLGDAYYSSNRYEDAIKTFETLAELSTGILKQRAYIKEIEAVWFKGSNPTILLDLTNRVEKFVAIDRLGKGYIHHNRGRALLHMRDPPGTLREHQEALRIFKEEYYLPKAADLIFAIGTLHVMLHMQGKTADETMQDKGFGEMLIGLNMFHELGDYRGEMMVAHRGLGFFFFGAGLFRESAKYYDVAFQIGEKIGAYDDTASTLDWLGRLMLISGNYQVSLSQALKALEIAEKTDAELTKSKLIAALALRYAMVGDLVHAQEYFDKFKKTPKEMLMRATVLPYAVFAETSILAIKGLWKESEERFKKMEEGQEVTGYYSALGWKMTVRALHAWALEKQGKAEEARIQKEEIQRFTREAEAHFAHANVRVELMARREVAVGEEFEVRLDLVNVATSPGVIIKIQDAIPAEFKVVRQPSMCWVQDSSLEMKQKDIEPWQVVSVKLNLKATKPGHYDLSPSVVYVDDLGENKTFNVEPIPLEVHSAQPTFETLPGRVTTGYWALDRLLLGGIPEKHAVILSSPSIDERELLIGKFLEAGGATEEITFDVAVDAGYGKALAEKGSRNFFFLLCNSQADAIFQNQTNVFKLKGIGSLTEIDITLIKMFRATSPHATGPKRICIEILSDVLLEHHALSTRRWLSALIPTLKSRGFTILAVINPQMHPPEESQAIRSLFDGEIEVAEKEHFKKLRVRRLSNQRYLDEELVLDREKLLV